MPRAPMRGHLSSAEIAEKSDPAGESALQRDQELAGERAEAGRIGMNFVGPARRARCVPGDRSPGVDQNEVHVVGVLAEQLMEAVYCIFYDSKSFRVAVTGEMQGRLQPGSGKYRMHIVRDRIIVAMRKNRRAR